jgi:cell division protein FtsW
VLVPGVGTEINGARRWFVVMGIMVQPSEFAKLALIIVISALIIKAGDRLHSFSQGLVSPLIFTSVICFLILCEPDFGTTVITGCLALTLLVIGGVRIQKFLMLLLAFAPLLFFYAFHRLGHVEDRIMQFLDRQPGCQLDFSLMAIGSGGLSGVGLGGSQCKLNFIPECESDFIFSIIGEELGFIGTSLVIFLFAALIFHGSRIIRGIRNRFGFMMASGVLLLISAQALVNIVVVVGMAPTKGLPLPFISSGGSSLMALMMGTGLFLNIARNPDLQTEMIRDEQCESWFQRLTTPHVLVSEGGNDDP